MIGLLVRHGQDGCDTMAEGVVKKQWLFHKGEGSIQAEAGVLAHWGAFAGRVRSRHLRDLHGK